MLQAPGMLDRSHKPFGGALKLLTKDTVLATAMAKELGVANDVCRGLGRPRRQCCVPDRAGCFTTDMRAPPAMIVHLVSSTQTAAGRLGHPELVAHTLDAELPDAMLLASLGAKPQVKSRLNAWLLQSANFVYHVAAMCTCL